MSKHSARLWASISAVVIIAISAFVVWSVRGQGFLLMAAPIVVIIFAVVFATARESMMIHWGQEQIELASGKEKAGLLEDIDLTQVPVKGGAAFKAEIRFYYKDGKFDTAKITKGSTQKVA